MSLSVLAVEVIPDFYKDPGLQPNRSYINQSFKEYIDPFTGALQLHYVDIHLPGDGGFDLSVVRSYNSVAFSETNPAAFDSQAGLGWQIHFGRVLHKSTLLPCTGSAFGVDTTTNPVVELPDGSTQVLLYSGTTSPLMLTTQRWKADCASGGMGLIVYSPDGVRYEMTQQVNVGSGANVRTGWYTKKITDRNGNTATITYTGQLSPRIVNVSTNDGRALNFGYVNGMVNTISTTLYTYTYNYEPVSGVPGAYYLKSVARPDNTSWTYDYNAVLNNVPGSYAIKRVTYPEGGNIDYGYGTTYSDYVLFDGTTRSTVVKTKSTSDGGNWSLAYSPGLVSTYDTTTVTGPSGTTKFWHVGPNYALSGSLWMGGLLMRKEYSEASSLVQKEEYAWGQQAVSPQQFKRPGSWVGRSDSATYAALMTGRTITRNGQTYSTAYSLHDEFGNPKKIVENGPNLGSRTTDLTYFSGAARWIVKQIKDQVVANGGVAIARDFDANGNLRIVTRDGVTTSYEYFPNGNLQKATFPRLLVHTYSDYKLGVARTENQPEGVQLNRTVDDVGNVTSETNGERKTIGYQYDGLNRIIRIDYPRGNPVDIAYTYNSKTATRGAVNSLQETTTYDGFGRPLTVTLGGIVRAYRHDSLGRLVFASNPGSTTIGTSYDYDILDRPKGGKNADGTTWSITYGPATKTVRNERQFSTTYVYRAYGDPDQPLLMEVQPQLASAKVALTRNAKTLVETVSQGSLTRSYAYWPNGYLKTVTNPETGATNYGRDDAGNMTWRTVGASSTVSYEYDGQNRLWRVTYQDATPQVTKTYTRTHKLKTVSTSVAARSYDYDDNGNLTTEQLIVDGRALTLMFGYNANDQLAQHRYPISNRVVDYAPDVLGRPRLVSGFVSAVDYHAWGQVKQIDYANGTTTTYGPHLRLWPGSFATSKAGTAYLSSTYGYDGVGNLYSISDSVDASYNRAMTHDELDRLATVNGPWGSGQIGYDAVGNIKSQVFGPASISYAYDSNNRLGSVSGYRSSTFSYDVYGNVTGAGSRAHAYDSAPNLLCANCNDPASKVEYQYDGLNQRVWSQRAGVRTYEFYGSDGKLLVEYTPSQSNRLVEHIYLGARRIAQVEPRPTTVSAGGGSGGLTAMARHSITLTATVAGSAPTGTMTFYEGTTLLGTAAVANGVASLPITFSTVGSHTVTVVYSGDALNAGSSSTVTVTVRMATEDFLPVLQLLFDE
ncbi:MAG: Ig-like domain repeat protein [Burkholderiaceae bacterium]